MKRIPTLVTQKELIYITILAIFFTFLSFIFYVRVEPTQILGIYFFLYGFPLEFLKIRSGVTHSYKRAVEIMWGGLIFDLALYFLVAFILVYTAKRLNEVT